MGAKRVPPQQKRTFAPVQHRPPIAVSSGEQGISMTNLPAGAPHSSGAPYSQQGAAMQCYNTGQSMADAGRGTPHSGYNYSYGVGDAGGGRGYNTGLLRPVTADHLNMQSQHSVPFGSAYSSRPADHLN